MPNNNNNVKTYIFFFIYLFLHNCQCYELSNNENNKHLKIYGFNGTLYDMLQEDYNGSITKYYHYFSQNNLTINIKIEQGKLQIVYINYQIFEEENKNHTNLNNSRKEEKNVPNNISMIYNIDAPNKFIFNNKEICEINNKKVNCNSSIAVDALKGIIQIEQDKNNSHIRIKILPEDNEIILYPTEKNTFQLISKSKWNHKKKDIWWDGLISSTLSKYENITNEEIFQQFEIPDLFFIPMIRFHKFPIQKRNGITYKGGIVFM